MQQRILDKVEESFKKAESFYGRTFDRPKNIIFQRTGTNAGHCCYGRSELMFQIAIAEKAGDSYIARTPAHEVAHWIEKEVYGYQYKPSGRRDVHGKKWQYIMVYVMKQDSSRCHSFDTSEVKGKRGVFAYCCSSGHSLNLSSVVHNRIVSGRKSYRCKCGGKLALKVDININSKQLEIERIKQQIKELQSKLDV